MMREGRGRTERSSAALFRSRIPSSAVSRSPMNFLVRSPSELSYRLD